MGYGLKHGQIRWTNKWLAFAAGMLLASANANADEFRFGEWRGEIDLTDPYPISISAYDVDEESSSSLHLMCTPPGWGKDPEGSPKPVLRGLFLDLSPGRIGVEREQQPCVVEAKGVTHRQEEVTVRSEALCGGSAVDASNVDKWGEILNLLSTVVIGAPDERPRITVHHSDGSEFTFLAPRGIDTSSATSWMHDACKRLRKSEGRIFVPGPTYGVWFTGYRYDEFHERILPASIQALARDGRNEVMIGCHDDFMVAHMTEDCRANALGMQPREIKSCSIYARIDGGPAIEDQALCHSLCFVRARANGKIVSAMQVGERSMIRVLGPHDERRDFTLSLWGFKSAHDWVTSKCPSLPEID